MVSLRRSICVHYIEVLIEEEGREHVSSGTAAEKDAGAVIDDIGTVRIDPGRLVHGHRRDIKRQSLGRADRRGKPQRAITIGVDQLPRSYQRAYPLGRRHFGSCYVEVL